MPPYRHHRGVPPSAEAGGGRGEAGYGAAQRPHAAPYRHTSAAAAAGIPYAAAVPPPVGAAAAASYAPWLAAGPHALPPPMQPLWITYRTPEGRPYYYNTLTLQTVWEPPSDLDALRPLMPPVASVAAPRSSAVSAAAPVAAPAAAPAAAGRAGPVWRAYLDAASGKTYYYNSETQQTTWTAPDAPFVPAAASATPTAAAARSSGSTTAATPRSAASGANSTAVGSGGGGGGSGSGVSTSKREAALATPPTPTLTAADRERLQTVLPRLPDPKRVTGFARRDAVEALRAAYHRLPPHLRPSTALPVPAAPRRRRDSTPGGAAPSGDAPAGGPAAAAAAAAESGETEAMPADRATRHHHAHSPHASEAPTEHDAEPVDGPEQRFRRVLDAADVPDGTAFVDALPRLVRYADYRALPTFEARRHAFTRFMDARARARHAARHAALARNRAAFFRLCRRYPAITPTSTWAEAAAILAADPDYAQLIADPDVVPEALFVPYAARLAETAAAAQARARAVARENLARLYARLPLHVSMRFRDVDRALRRRVPSYDAVCAHAGPGAALAAFEAAMAPVNDRWRAARDRHARDAAAAVGTLLRRVKDVWRRRLYVATTRGDVWARATWAQTYPRLADGGADVDGVAWPTLVDQLALARALAAPATHGAAFDGDLHGHGGAGHPLVDAWMVAVVQAELSWADVKDGVRQRVRSDARFRFVPPPPEIDPWQPDRAASPAPPRDAETAADTAADGPSPAAALHGTTPAWTTPAALAAALRQLSPPLPYAQVEVRDLATSDTLDAPRPSLPPAAGALPVTPAGLRSLYTWLVRDARARRERAARHRREDLRAVLKRWPTPLLALAEPLVADVPLLRRQAIASLDRAYPALPAADAAAPPAGPSDASPPPTSSSSLSSTAQLLPSALLQSLWDTYLAARLQARYPDLVDGLAMEDALHCVARVLGRQAEAAGPTAPLDTAATRRSGPRGDSGGVSGGGASPRSRKRDGAVDDRDDAGAAKRRKDAVDVDVAGVPLARFMPLQPLAISTRASPGSSRAASASASASVPASAMVTASATATAATTPFSSAFPATGRAAPLAVPTPPPPHGSDAAAGAVAADDDIEEGELDE